MDLKLRRFAQHPVVGTFGEMSIGGVTLFTVERPWLDNRPYVSCIPTGTYECKPRYFYRGGYDAIEVTNVPGRTHILFHIANLPSDLAGCIGVGYRLGCLRGQWAVLDSRRAFKFMMEIISNRPWMLEVRDAE